MHIKSLRSHLVFRTLLLVIFTALAVVLPMYWFHTVQVNNQLQYQIEQGIILSNALLDSQFSQLEAMARLTSQRPTLRRLMLTNDLIDLDSYLRELQTGTGYDLVALCDNENVVVTCSPGCVSDQICRIDSIRSEIMIAEDIQTVWIIEQGEIFDDEKFLGWVIIGEKLDNDLLIRMKIQSGLEHSLFLDNRSVESSMEVKNLNQEVLRSKESRAIYPIMRGKSVYTASRYSLQNERLNIEVAYDITGILKNREIFLIYLLVSMATVIIVGSAMGIYFAGSISKPLEKLSGLTHHLTVNHISEQIRVETEIREVQSLAQTLEMARVNLSETLKSLQDEKDWSEKLLTTVVEGIITVDEGFSIRYFSPGAERITGWQKEEVLSLHINDVFNTSEANLTFLELLPPPGEKRSIPVFLSESRRAILAVTLAKQSANPTSEENAVLVFRDVTEETALNRLIGHFMGNITHEFRTPLSSLAASTELLLQNYKTLENHDTLVLLSNIHLGILSLESLIDNLIEGASIETGRFRVTPRICDLKAIVNESLQVMTPLLHKYDQRLVLHTQERRITVLADHKRIVQVLINLLSNASRYGPRNADIQVSLTEFSGYVEVAIADRGPGIPSQYQSDLFMGLLSTNIETNLMKKGSGIGLSVVKAIIDAHNGKVGVKDNPGGGSVFWFQLPVKGQL